MLLAATALRHLDSLYLNFGCWKLRDVSEAYWPTVKSWLQHCCWPAWTDFCLAPLSTLGAHLTCLTLSSWPTYNIVPYLLHLTGLQILQLKSINVDEEGADQVAGTLAALTLSSLARGVQRLGVKGPQAPLPAFIQSIEVHTGLPCDLNVVWCAAD